MRLGGPVFGFTDPESWVREVKRWEYRAAYCPVGEDTPAAEVEAYVAAAQKADILIAEVGVWNNALDPDPEKRRANLERAKRRLELAERIGARCAVNIAGSRGERWDGPHAADYLPETLDMIVETIREILDDVQPRGAKYALETMPYMLPDSAESSLELVRAIDRPGFAIHFDPVNLINSPRRYFDSRGLVRDYIDKVGAHIVAVHLKDVALEPRLTVHLSEVRLGLGGFDIKGCLEEVERLDADMPVLLEHLPTEEDYRLAREYLASL